MDARHDDVDPTHLSLAGAYDHIVGGTDNTLADRQAVAEYTQKWPGVADNAVHNALFEARVVKYFADQGIRQILDLGAGKPKPPPRINVHELLARETGDGRVVYVERDPTAHAQARAVWGAAPTTAYIEADIRDADRVLSEVQDRQLLDLTRPVGVLLLAVLHYIDADPAEVTAPYAAAVPSGSFLAVTHMVRDGAPAELLHDLEEAFAPAGGAFVRDHSEVETVWQGWPLVEPGVVEVRDWRVDDPAEHGPLQLLAGVARKP